MAELPNRSVWDLFGDVKAASDETPDCVRPSVLAKSAPVSKNTVYYTETSGTTWLRGFEQLRKRVEGRQSSSQSHRYVKQDETVPVSASSVQLRPEKRASSPVLSRMCKKLKLEMLQMKVQTNCSSADVAAPPLAVSTPVRNIDEDAQRQKPAMETKTVTSICAVEDPVANTAKSVVEQCVTKPRTGGPIPLLESLSNLRNLLSKKSFNEMTVEEADKTHMMPHAASRSHVVSNLRSSDVVVTNKLNNIDDNSVKCNNQTDLSTDSHTVIAANGLSLAVDKYYHLSSVDDVLSQKLKPTASALGLSLNLSNDLICAVQPNRQDDENSEDGPNELGSKQTCSDEETVPGVKKQCHCADNETPVPRLMSSEIILTSKCQIVDDEVEQAGSTVTEESTLQSELRMATESQEVGYLYSPTEECRYKESVEQDRSAKKSCSHDLNGMTSTALFDVNQSECSVAKACLCSKNELTGSSEHVVDFLIASGTRLASDSVETEVHECAKLRTECSDSVSSMIKRDAGADTVESVKNVENDSCERGINYIQIVDDCISERTSHPIATIASSQQLFTNISKQRLESFTMVRNSSCKDPEFSSKSNCNNSEEGAADVASISDEPSSHVMHKTKQPDASGSLRVPVCSNVIPNLHSLRFELKSEEHVPSCEVLQVPIESQSENGFESCVVSEDSVRWKATDVINRTSDCRGLTRSSSAEFSWQLILASKTACPSVRPSEVSVEGTNCCNCNKTAYLSLHCRKAGILDCFVPCLFCQSKRSVGSRFSKNVVLEASDCNKVIVFEKANIQSGAISDSNFIVNYSSSNNSDFTSTSSALVVPSYSSETASNKRSVPLSLPLVQDVCVLDSAGARHSSENDACMPTGWLQDVSLVSNTADQLADTLVNRKSCFSETEAVLYEVTAELDDAVPVSLDVVESECRLLKASVAETCSSDESWCNSNTNGLQGLSGDVASTGHSCSSVETSSHQQNLPMEKSDGQREVSVESEEADLKIEERFVHLDANCNGCSVELLSFGNDNVITDSAEPFELSLSGDANVSDNSRLPKCVEMREKQKADGQNVVPSEDAVETDEKLSCNFVNLSTDPQIDRIIRTLLEPCSSLRTEHAPDYNMPTVHANSLCSETRNVDCCSTVELPEDTCFGPDNRSFLESYIHTDKGSPLPDIGLLSAVLEGACLDQVRPSSVGSQHSCSSSLDSLSFVDKLPEVDSVVDRSTSHDGNAPADTVVNRLAAVLQFDRETKSEAGDAFTIKVDGAVSLCDVMPTCSNPGHHDLFCPSSHTSRAAEFAGASEDHPSNGAVPDAISSLETVCGYDVPSPIRGVGETCSSLFTSDSAGDDCANDVGQPVPAAFRFTSACSAVRLEEARASLSIADVPKQGEKCPRNYIDGADFFNGCVAAVRRTSHCDASSSLPAGSRSTVSPPVAVKCCCGSGSGGSKRHCRTLLRMPEKLLHVDNRSSAAGDRRIPLFSLAAGGSAAARRRKFLAVLMNREGTSRLQRKRGLGAVSGRDDSEDLRKTDAANDEDVNVESCASHPLQCSELDVDRLTNAVSKGVCDSSVSSSSFRGRRSTLEKTYLQAENANLGSTEKPADSRKDTARLSDVQSATNLLSATRQKIRLTASVDEKYRKFEETDVSAGKFQSSVQPVSEQTDCLATSADEDAGGDDSSVNVQKNGGGTFKVQMPVKDEDIDCAIERDETPDCCAIIMHSVTDNWRSNVKHVTDITTDDLKAPPTNALVQIDFSHKENAVDTTRPENGSHDMSDAMCVCNVARAVSSINIDITAVASSPGSERPADGSLCDELCEKSADSEKPSIGIDTIPENAERWVKSAMRQELYSHSKEEKMNKNGSNLDCLTPAKRAGRKRRSLLLKQLANTEGYVADKKGTQNERDNLLVDSTLLDREQRALQMALMRMREMETLEELKQGQHVSRRVKRKSDTIAKRRTSATGRRGVQVYVTRERKRLVAGSRRPLHRTYENVERPQTVRCNAVRSGRKVRNLSHSNLQVTRRVTRHQGSRYALRTRMKTSDYIGNRPATNCRKKWLIRKLSLDNGRSTRRQMSQSTLGVTYEDDEASNMPSENESITDQTADDVAFRRLQRKTYHAAAAAAVATCRTSDVQVTWSRRQVEMLRKRCHGKVHSYMLGRCDELVEHSDTSNARESPDAVPVDCLSPASSMPTALNVDSEIGSNADGHGCAQEVSPSDFPSGSQSRSESCRSVTSCKDAIRGSTIGDIRSRRRRRNRWQAGNWQKRAKLMKKLGRRSPKSSSPVLVQDDDSRTLDCFPSDALMAIAAETDRETGSAVEESLVTVTTCFLADHFPDANGVEQESEGTRPSLEMCTTGSLATVETIIEDHKDEPDNSNVTSLLIAPEVVDVVQTSEVSAECCHSSVTEAAEESKCLVEELTDCVSGSLTDAVSSRENVDTVDCVSESFHVESRVPAAGVVPDSPLALSTCSKSSERSDERLHVGTLSRTSSSVSVRDECASDVSVPLPADADNTDVVIVTRRRDLLGSMFSGKLVEDVTSAVNAFHIPPEIKKIATDFSTGETVLHKAARLGYVHVARWCCQTGYVDVNARDNADYTPLHESCAGGHTSVAECLIYYGADINAVSRLDGARPLHDAVESDNIETVRLLLSAGADVSLTTYSGKTVFHLCRSEHMRNFLQAYVIDLNGSTSQWRFEESDWFLEPSWCVSSDILSSLPPDPDEFELSNQLVIECSEAMFPATYYLRPDDQSGWDTYVLLADVIRQLGVTRRQFLDKHGDVTTSNISWNAFKMQTMLADFDAVERRLCAMEDEEEIDAGVNRSEQYFENNRFASRIRLVTVIKCSSPVRQLLEVDAFKATYQLY